MLIPASSSAISASYAPKTQLQLLKLLVSNDKSQWHEVAVGSDAHPYATGWSEINVKSTDSWRYARIQSGQTNCMFAEMQFVGVLVPTSGPKSCDVNVTAVSGDGTVVNTATLSAAYSYSTTATPQVTSVDPTFGTAAGGTQLTISGVQSSSLTLCPLPILCTSYWCVLLSTEGCCLRCPVSWNAAQPHVT
jgi:hypothetical protein